MWKHRVAVIAGGAIGGVFWLLTQFIGGHALPASALVYGYAILGGALAGGIAVYVSADFLDQTKLEKMFFFSAAAGLSFPSFISTIANAKDVAQIQGTNRQVEQTVSQVSSPTASPTQIAQAIKQAGTTLSVNPASADVKLKFDAASKTAINNLSATAQHSSDPTNYVKALEQIGTIPQFHSDASSELLELSNSKNPHLSAAARPAFERLNYSTIQFNNAVATGPRAAEPSPTQPH